LADSDDAFRARQRAASAHGENDEAPMIGATPQFPAIDDWQKMSETEQDALLARMESARRRGALLNWLLIALACMAAGAGIVLAILKMG
jgi:hypothetical protein